MIKTVIKHKLAELAINNLFDKVIQNFQDVDTTIRVGECITTIKFINSNIDPLLNCRVISIHMDQYLHKYRYTLTADNRSGYYSIYEDNIAEVIR